MDYVRGFSHKLDELLHVKLGLVGSSAQRVCESYFALPSSIMAQREQLTARLARLEEADSELTNFVTQC